MLLRYGDEVKRGLLAFKAGDAPGAGRGGGWVPFGAAGAAWVVGADIVRGRALRGADGTRHNFGGLKNAAHGLALLLWAS